MKTLKVYDAYPKAVQFRFTDEEWSKYKSICVDKGESPHGNIRKYIKNYIKNHEKSL